MNIILRDATEADYSEVAELYALPQRTYADIFTGADQFIKEFSSQAYLKEDRFKSYLTKEKGTGLLIAEVDGEMAGIICYKAAGIVDHPDGTSEPSAYAEQISVKEKFRGQHIGTMLMDVFDARMKEAGINYTILDVMQNNRARKIYEERGYKVVNAAYDKIIDETGAPSTGRSFSPSNIKVSFAKAADWPAVEALELASQTVKTGIRFYDDSGRHAMDKATFDRVLMSPQEEQAMLVATVDGEVVGYVQPQIVIGRQVDRKHKNLCDIYNMAAANSDVLDSLVDASVKYAIENGCRAVRTYADADDRKLQTDLERNGFQPFRQFMQKPYWLLW
jgi:ribosomal protein S18 acetylase RimI-like enzyme